MTYIAIVFASVLIIRRNSKPGGTFQRTATPDTGLTIVSPVSGVAVRWNVPPGLLLRRMIRTEAKTMAIYVMPNLILQECSLTDGWLPVLTPAQRMWNIVLLMVCAVLLSGCTECLVSRVTLLNRL